MPGGERGWASEGASEWRDVSGGQTQAGDKAGGGAPARQSMSLSKVDHAAEDADTCAAAPPAAPDCVRRRPAPAGTQPSVQSRP